MIRSVGSRLQPAFRVGVQVGRKQAIPPRVSRSARRNLIENRLRVGRGGVEAAHD